MIVKLDKTWSQCSEYPDTNFTGDEKVLGIIDETTPAGAIMADTVKRLYPCYEVAVDEKGMVTAVVESRQD